MSAQLDHEQLRISWRWTIFSLSFIIILSRGMGSSRSLSVAAFEIQTHQRVSSSAPQSEKESEERGL